METPDLATLLPLTDGALTLAAGTAPGILLSDQISRLTNGLPLRVREATRTIDGDTVRVSGKASLLNLPDVPVVVEVKPNSDGLELTTSFTLHELTAGATLPLTALCQQLGLPTPPALTVDTLQFVAHKAGNFSLAATMAGTPGWTLDLGPVQPTISAVQLALRKPSGGALSGKFSGALALGEALTLAMECDSTGVFSLRAPLPTVQLHQLISKFSNQPVPLPNGFDLTFTDGTVLIQKEMDSLAFQFATTMANLGTVAFAARRVSAAQSTWGFSAGIDLTAVRLSGLPGLGGLSAFEDMFQLNSLLLVVASFDDPGFTFPNLAAFASPTLSTGHLALPAQAGGIRKGLNIYAKWQLDTTRKEQKLLRSLLRLDASLAVALQVGAEPSQNSRLYVSFATTIKGMAFNCLFGGQLSAGQVSLFLTGTLLARIQGQPVQFDTTLLFVPTGAFVSGSMLGSVAIPFAHLTLSNLALAIGVDWEGVPSLGIAATLTINTFQSSLAVFFDSADPAKSMLAGSISDLTLRDVVTAFAHATIPPELDQALAQVALTGTSDVTIGDVAAALDHRELDKVAAALAAVGISVPASSSQLLLVVGQPGTSWFLTDMTTMLHYELVKQGTGIRVRLNPQLYFAPQTTNIGALVFPQAFYINAKLKIFSFEAMVKVMVMPSQGVAVDGAMSRIVIGNETLFSIEAESDHTQGPRISLATFSQAAPAAAQAPVSTQAPTLTQTLTQLSVPSHAPNSLRGYQAVEMARAQAMAQAMAQVQARSQAMAAYYQLANGRNGSYGGYIPPQLANGGNGSYGGYIPPAAPVAQPQGQKPHFQLDGKVTLLGTQRGISVSIDNTGAAFQLTGALVPGVTADLHGRFSSQADLRVGGTVNVGIGSVNLGPLGTVTINTGAQGGLDLGVNKTDIWATFQGGVQFAGQGISLPAVSLDVKTASLAALPQKLADLVVTALKDFFKDAGVWAQYVKQGLVTGVQDVGKVLKDVYNQTADQAAKVLKNAGYALTDVGNSLKGAYNVAAADAARILKGAGYAVNDVGNALKGAYSLTAQQAAGLLHDAGYVADEVGNALKAAYGATADQAAMFMRGSFPAQQVSSALKTTYGTSVEQVAGFLKGASYEAYEISNGLKNVYGASAQQATQLLRNAGYTANDVVKGLKSAYGATTDQAAQFMRGAGYAANEVSGALKNAWQATAGPVGMALKGAGYSVNEITNTLKTGFNSTADEAAYILKVVGSTANDVSASMKGAYNLTAQQSAQLLRTAGYAINDVSNGLKTAYGATADQAAQLLRGVQYGANEVGGALKSVYGASAQQTAQVLRGAGYAANDVGNALKSAYGATTDQAAALLKGAGYTVDEIGNILKGVWGATANGVAVALKGAGYGVNEVGNFVKNGFGLNPNDLKSVLEGAGYATDQIKGFFNSLGGDFAKVFTDLGKQIEDTGKKAGEVLNPTHWGH